MPLLDYANPRTDRRPWGPITFRPSRRSFVLFFIAAAAFVWLRFRHEPWRQTGTVAGQGYAYFTPDNQLLTYDPASGLHLHNHVTGQRLRTIVPPGDPKDNPERWFLKPQGPHVFVIPEAGQPIRIFEFATGRLIAVLSNPRVPTESVLAVDPVSPRFVTGDDNNFRSPPAQGASPPKLWTLIRSDGSPATSPGDALTFGARDLPMFGDATFSPDGKRLLQTHSRRPEDGFALVDADTGRVVLRQPTPESIGLQTGFLDARTFWVIEAHRATAASSPPGRVEFRNTLDGHVTQAFEVAIPLYSPNVRASVSANGQVVEVDDPRSRHVDFYEATTGRLVTSHDDRPMSGAALLRDSNRFFARDSFSGYPALYSLRSTRPIAILRLRTPAPLNPACVASPDGQTILFVDRDSTVGWTTHLFHPTGPDCPESPLGLLAFPHAWLLIVSVTALALSLPRDASPTQSSPLSNALVLAILLLTLPRTLQFVLEAARGELLLTPAPLLLLCGIGLATGSRFWQAVTILPLVAELIVLTYCLQQIRIGWLLGATAEPLPLLDRSYEMPILALFIPLTAALVSIPVAILILGRRAMARTAPP